MGTEVVRRNDFTPHVVVSPMQLHTAKAMSLPDLMERLSAERTKVRMLQLKVKAELEGLGKELQYLNALRTRFAEQFKKVETMPDSEEKNDLAIKLMTETKRTREASENIKNHSNAVTRIFSKRIAIINYNIKVLEAAIQHKKRGNT